MNVRDTDTVKAVSEHEAIVSTVCYVIMSLWSDSFHICHTMTSTTSFNIGSEYRIDALCEMVLGVSEYQQAGGGESNIENSELMYLSSY